MRSSYRTILLFLTFFLFLTKTSWAYPPELEWRTIETEHFRIHYHEGTERLAERTARMSEAMFDEMVPLMDWDPGYKPEFTVVDHTDSPNGWANVIPYSQSTFYAVPPSTNHALNDYDDWKRVLIIHEFTHVLQLDVRRGFPALVHMVGGKTFHPNQMLPRFYTEGMAQYYESHFTAGGRNRSSTYEMYMRMDILEGNERRLDQITGDTARWPGGTLAYLYGAKFMAYLSDRYGEKTYAAMSYLLGQMLVPYSLSAWLRQVGDMDWPDLYDQWMTGLKARYQTEMERLKELGLTPVTKLTDTGDSHWAGRIDPTGRKILMFHADALESPNWKIYDLETGDSETLLELRTNGGIDWGPDGTELVYSTVSYPDRRLPFHDLYLYDMKTGLGKQITFDRRAREPAFSRTGRRIAYVSYQTGFSHLEILDLDRNKTIEPFDRERFDQVFAPTWSPDGRLLAFGGFEEGGFKHIYLYDTQTKELRQVTHTGAINFYPSFSPDGRTLVYSSDRSGIFNAYAYDLERGTTHQMTNVLAGVFGPQISPDGRRLYFTTYSSNGYDLAYTDLADTFWIEEPEAMDIRVKFEPFEPEMPYVDRDYSPFPALYPHHWRPDWGQDHAGDTLGISTYATDPAERHSWSAAFDYGIQSKQPTFGVGYTARVFYPTISMRFAHTSYTLHNGGRKDGAKIDQDESRYSGGMSFSYSFRGTDNRFDDIHGYAHSLYMSYNFRYLRLLNSYTYEPLEDAPSFVDTGFLGSLSFGYSYSNLEGRTGFIGAAKGRSFGVSLGLSHDVFGSEYNGASIYGSYNEYIPNPWVAHHSLALRIVGGMGAYDYRNRQVFYIGGPPERDIVDDIIKDERQWGDYVRGYKPYSLSGDKYILLRSEYRFPIWNIERGVYTLPLFFRRIHAAPFFDMASIWTKDFTTDSFAPGVGGEIRLDMLTGYFDPLTLRVGYMAGLSKHYKDARNNTIYFGLDNIY